MGRLNARSLLYLTCSDLRGHFFDIGHLLLLHPATARSEPIVSVTRSGEAYQIDLRMDVASSRTLAWRVLTDYENLQRFVPGMQSSRIVSGRGEPLLLEQMGASSTYLEQTRRQTGQQLGQLVRSERIRTLLSSNSDPKNVQRVLAEVADSNNLDYLLIIEENGRIVASNSGHSAGMVLPPDYVVEQAREGVVTSAFERFEPSVLELLGKNLQSQAIASLPEGGNHSAERRGLAIHAAAHFPLAVDGPNAMLVGGILLNRNAPLIEHMRELVYPVGTRVSLGCQIQCCRDC